MKVLLSRNIEKNKIEFFNSIREKLNNNELVYLIVPEQFTLGTEIEAFDALNLSSTINLKIKSFTSLTNEILHYAGKRNINLISEQAKFLMIQSILIDVKYDLKMYQDNIYDKEFIDLFIRFIDSMIENDYGIEFIDSLMYREEISEELKKKLEDIKIVFSRYIELKINSGYSSKSKYDIASECIDDITLYKKANFYFYKYHDMSKKEMDLLERINKIAKFVMVNITLDERIADETEDKNTVKDIDVFDISYKFFEKLKRNIGDIDAKTPQSQNSFNTVQTVANNIFRYDTKTVQREFENSKLQNIYVKRTNNTSEEVERLALDIKKDIIDNGYSYNEIAVLAINSDEYFPKIKKNFEINNIPFFIDENRKLLDNAMIKFIKAGIELIKVKANANSSIKFLKTAFLDLDRESINLFESYILKRNLHSNMIFEEKYYSLKESDRYYEEDKENIEKIIKVRDLLQKIVKSNDIISNLHSQEKQMKEFVETFYNFFSQEELLKNYSVYENSISEEEREENRIIWQSFIELLDDMYLINRENLDLSTFIEILLSGIDNFKVGIIPPSQDQVAIGSIKRSRFNNVRKLYILGMTNLYYPPSNDDVDILSNEEKNELINNEFEIRNTIESNDSNDLLSFFEIINSAKESLAFSYSLVNSSNEAMAMAYMLNTLLYMIPSDNNLIFEKNDLDNVYLITSLSEYIPTKLKGDDSQFAREIYKQIRNSKKYNKILHSVELSNKNHSKNNINRDIAEKIYNLNKFSVSQLETFNENPYNHFIRYGIKPRETQNYELSRIDTGNILHSYMQEFIDAKYNKGQEINSEEIFTNTVSKLLDEYKKNDEKNKFYLRQMKDNAEIYTKVIDDQLAVGKVDHIDLEVKYGRNSSYKPVNINIENKDIFIEGVIDRVDKITIGEENYYRVIDYKTGSKEFDPSKIYAGIDLQLLLYLQAVIESDKNGKPLGAFYQKLNQEYYLIDELAFDKLKEEKVFDNLKLSGLINSDEKVFNFVEKEVDSNKASKSSLYQFKGRRGKLVDKENAFSTNMFKGLFELNKDNIKKTITSIYEGNIELNPYKLSGMSPYDYSDYKTIDKGEGLTYRYLDKYNYDFLKMILEKREEE